MDVMPWTPMCGQTWLGAAASFVGTWAVMMMAMMLPSLLPTLWRHGLARGARAGTGYFFVWAVLGVFVFAGGAALAQIAMQVPVVSRAVPVSGAMTVLLAGAFQFSAWKARHLACWRNEGARKPAHAGSAWRHGVRLGLQCSRACAGLTAVLLVIGVMDWRAMAAITAAITAERLAPQSQRVAWMVGAIAIATGTYLMARAVS